MQKQRILLTVLLLTVLNGCSGSGGDEENLTLPAGDENTTEEVCVQVITHAYDPQTLKEQDFSTPCDVPEGWVIGTPPQAHIPVITLLGNATMTLVAGTAFHDPGATAFDEEDGDISSSIRVEGAVDTTRAGTYLLRYSVTDSSGKEAESITRTIIVEPVRATVGYESNASQNLINPDRGMYAADYGLDRERNYDPFASAYANGYRLVYSSLNLADYNETETLPNDFLSTVTENLSKAKAAHIGVILRIKYRNNIDSNDPEKSLILSHLQQLEAVLQPYEETIVVAQAGLIGSWGEWHSFTGDFDEGTDGYLQNRREVLNALAAILPHTPLQIRTPMHKEQLLGSSAYYGEEGSAAMITEAEAYGTTLKSRLGHHNDCFLRTITDSGTYVRDNIAFWKSYVANDTRFTPMGGETCGIGDGDEAYLSDCDNALHEMRTLHFSFLNDDYHPDVLQKWKDQGCYDTIREDLGYRFTAQSLHYSYDAEGFDLRLNLNNEGFASPYRFGTLSFVLQNDSRHYRFSVSADMRRWESGQTQEIEKHFDLSNVEAGTYCLYLQINAPTAPIALANKDTWRADLGMNRLACDIKIFH